MEFRLLGPLEVWEGGQQLRLGGCKPRDLLAALLLAHDRVVSISRLVDEAWGAAPPASATALVHMYVSSLRRMLANDPTGSGPPEVIVTRTPGYMLRTTSGQLDMERFEQHAKNASEAMSAHRYSEAAEGYRQALALWRGPFLDGIDSLSAQAEAARLNELRLAIWEERIEADLALGRADALVPELTGLVAAYPLRERMRGQLMTALYRVGSAGRCVGGILRGSRNAADEVGLEPGPKLQRLYKAILTADPTMLGSGNLCHSLTQGDGYTGGSIDPLVLPPQVFHRIRRKPRFTSRVSSVPARQPALHSTSY